MPRLSPEPDCGLAERGFELFVAGRESHARLSVSSLQATTYSISEVGSAQAVLFRVWAHLEMIDLINGLEPL
jgi:hypothetical protein